MDDDLLVGRYQRRRPLGSGGMGDVWLAEDLELGREVAVKRLRFGSPAGLDAELVERMQREARVVARLKHPAIVTLHDLVRVEGRPYLIMEYVAGESLAERIARLGPLPWAEVAPVVADIAGALAAAHRAGVQHRDVKPANLLLDLDGGGHLADFGIARGAEDAAITRAGELIGTVAYMPPEVARENLTTSAGDVWSLGATFFAAVEGAAPFAESGASVPAIINKLIHEDAPAARSAGACTTLLAAMLSADHQARPSAAEVEQEIRRLLVAAVPPPAPVTRESPVARPSPVTDRRPVSPPTVIARATRPRRGRRVVAGLGVVLVLVGGATAFLVLGGADDDPDRSGTPPEASRTASEVSGPSRSTFGTVTVGAGATRLELSPDGATSYVANRDDGTVSVIDNASGEVTTIEACRGPLGITVSPDGGTLYAPCQEGVVVFVDVVTEQAVPVRVQGTPGPLRLSDDGATLYVPTDEGNIEVIDTATRRTTQVGVGSTPGLVHLTPDGASAYTPDPLSGAVIYLDTSTLTGNPIATNRSPNGMQINARGDRAYVTTGFGRIAVLDLTVNELVSNPDLGEPTTGRIRLSPDDAFGWLPYPGTDTIKVLDLSDDTLPLVKDVAVGGTPGLVVTFDADGSTAYVPDITTGDVAVIDTATYAVTHLAAGEAPRNLTLSPDGATLYAVGSAPDDDGLGRVTAVALG